MKIKTTLVIISLILFSCSGSSIESDAQKVADLQCKAQELLKKVMSGDQLAQKESQELSIKAQELNLKMTKKYSKPEDKHAFTKALLEASGNCN